MLSLAPIRYSKALKRNGGPIERLEYGKASIQGKTYHQANAYLSRHLNLKKAETRLFSAADGSGAHPSAMIARHMAISETLERWAYYHVSQTGADNRYGFRTDSTTSGMAAFPGLFKRTAREMALLEAVERYCLVHWWNGWLPHAAFPTRLPGVRAIRIENPLTGATVIVCWSTTSSGLTGYGVAAARRPNDALWKALVEMERSNLALQSFHRSNPGFGKADLPALTNHLERRLLHYALPEGHASFLERLEKRPLNGSGKRPQPVVDTEIAGPWDRYATVWRILFPLENREHLEPRVMTFFW